MPLEKEIIFFTYRMVRVPAPGGVFQKYREFEETSKLSLLTHLIPVTTFNFKTRTLNPYVLG